MIATVAIYGVNFVVSRHAVLNGLGPYDLTALRFGVAGLLLLPLFLWAGWRDCAGIGWGKALMLTLMSGAPIAVLTNLGLSLAPAAHGAAIQPGLVTIIGAVGSMLIFGFWPRPLAIAGLLLAIVGLAALAIGTGYSASANVLRGDLLFFAGGVIWGFYPIMVRYWRLDPLRATAVVAVLSMVFLPFYVLWLEPRLLSIDPWVVAIHGLNQGVLNVIVGLWLWTSATHVLGPAIVSRFPPLIPVIGMLLAIPVLGEIPGPWQVGGIALIVGGLLLAAIGGMRPVATPAS